MKLPSYTRLGTDLALTRYVGTPSAVPLESADSWGALDLEVVAGGQGGLRASQGSDDLGTVSGRANLGQALILRLLTPRGSLAGLGHPNYGSRLVDLVGRLNNDRSRNLARLYTLQALGEEPRVRQVLGLAVEVMPDQPDVIRIGFEVLPLDDDQPLSLALEVAL
jgi:phage baseplate assembly protein W